MASDGGTVEGRRVKKGASAPIRGDSAASFGAVWLAAVAVAVLVLLPLITIIESNNFDAVSTFIDGIYQRKEVSAAERLKAIDGGKTSAMGKGRLFIVGGSGTLFGVDGEVMEKRLGVPVVNFGSHAGLGMEYILDRARRALLPGDMAVLCPEHGIWAGEEDSFTDVEWAYFNSYDKRFFWDIGLKRGIKALYSVPVQDYFTSMLRWKMRWMGDHSFYQHMYDVSTMGPNGDLRIAALRVPDLGPTPSLSFIDHVDTPAAAALARFAGWAKQHEVQLLYSWPNQCQPDAVQPKAWMMPPAVMTDFIQSLGIQILNEPPDTAFPRDWFMDTKLHTDPACRQLRTEDLIRRLRPVLGLKQAPEEASAYFVMTGGDHWPNEGNIFADDPAVQFKYLSSKPERSKDAVVPDDVVKWAQEDKPVYFDDPRVEELTLPLGYAGVDSMKKLQTLADWFAAYPEHVFAFVKPGGAAWKQPLPAGVPAGLAKALTTDGSWTCIVGTGRYASVERPVGARVREMFSSLVGKSTPALWMSLRATRGAEMPSLMLNAHEFVKGPQGVYGVVIDPKLATVVKSAAFIEGVPYTSWRRKRLVPIGEALQGASPVQMKDLDCEGNGRPTVRTAEGGTEISFPKLEGICGWNIALHSELRRAVMTVTLAGGRQGNVQVLLKTNRPDGFEYVRQPVQVDAGEEPVTITVPIALRAGATFIPDGYAVAGIQAMDEGAKVRVLRWELRARRSADD